MQIALALVLILISIYLVQIKISLLPFWHSLETWWFIQAFGSFGVVTILFFCIGTFITLALTPILFLKTKQFNGALSH
jgi:long-subunit acyl-CoA synthetase (AMP-forming)